MLRRLFIVGLILFSAGFVSAGERTIEIHGAFDVKIEDASADLIFNERAGIWMLQLRSPREYKKERGVGFSVNVFFYFPVVFR